MNKYSKLVKNSAVFAMGSLGSHVILFLLIRFYTEKLTREQYGMIDVMTTTVSLVVPIISLAIVDAVLRFSIDDENPKIIFTNGLFVAICGSIFFGLIGPLFFIRTRYYEFFAFIAVLVFLNCTNNICAQYIRGIGKVSLFTIAGIIKTIALAGSNILFLLGFGWKVKGYLLSIIVAELASILFLLGSSQTYKEMNFIFRPNIPKIKEMIKYSIPIIPCTLSWWSMNAADKYEVVLLLGVSSNGLYAIAHKLPSLVNICNTLFFQAWQLSAVEESQNEKKAEFYSNVFNVLAFCLFMVAAVLFVLLKPIMKFLTAAEFEDAWRYSPFLIIGMVFAAFSSFLGTNYVAMKETTGAMKTAITGAVINIFLNYVFIKLIGLNGAAFATMISFAIIWIYRVYDTKEFVVISYKLIPLILSIVLLIVQSVLMISGWEFSMYFGLLVCICILFLYNREVKLICWTIQKIHASHHKMATQRQ